MNKIILLFKWLISSWKHSPSLWAFVFMPKNEVDKMWKDFELSLFAHVTRKE